MTPGARPLVSIDEVGRAGNRIRALAAAAAGRRLVGRLVLAGWLGRPQRLDHVLRPQENAIVTRSPHCLMISGLYKLLPSPGIRAETILQFCENWPR